MPTSSDHHPVMNPANPLIVLDDSAHKDRKIFFLPSDWLFWAKGTIMTAEGKQYLSGIGDFMEKVPSRVVVSEVGPDARGTGQTVDLARSLAVMQFFTKTRKLPEDLFSITSTPPRAPARMRTKRVVAVTLIPTKVY